MKIAIIGGSGFVGTRLIESLKTVPLDQIVNYDKRESFFYPDLSVLGNVMDLDLLTNSIAGCDIVVLLAAEHRDDVSPKSLYYEVNVGGMKNVLIAMERNGIKRIIFTSSVAVYGLDKVNPSEDHKIDPFNDYGKTKWLAEVELQNYFRNNPNFNINIIRPTVIFGERNRGNVYNLLKQISSGRFLMVGDGRNSKSMAYVGNVVDFIVFLLKTKTSGYNVYNYVDKPDFTMNNLVEIVGRVINKKVPTIHVPKFIGMLGGYGFDLVAKLKREKLNISSVRVKKFCATTQFDSAKMYKEFNPKYSLEEGLAKTLNYEFLEKRSNEEVTFITE